MGRYKVLSILPVMALAMLIAASPSPISVSAVDPTLDAAIGVISKATHDTMETRNAIAYTRAAVNLEVTRQKMFAQQTAAAVSIQQTLVAADLTRQVIATRQAMENLAQQATAKEMSIKQTQVVEEATQQVIARATSVEVSNQAIQIQARRDSQEAILGVIRIILLLVLVAGLAIACVWALVEVVKRVGPHKGGPPTGNEILPTPPTRVVYDLGAAQAMERQLSLPGASRVTQAPAPSGSGDIDRFQKSGDRMSRRILTVLVARFYRRNADGSLFTVRIQGAVTLASWYHIVVLDPEALWHFPQSQLAEQGVLNALTRAVGRPVMFTPSVPGGARGPAPDGIAYVVLL
jgi:hypothetical protein